MANRLAIQSNSIGRPELEREPMKYLQAVLTKIYLLGHLVLIFHARLRKIIRRFSVADGLFLKISTLTRFQCL